MAKKTVNSIGWAMIKSLVYFLAIIYAAILTAESKLATAT